MDTQRSGTLLIAWLLPLLALAEPAQPTHQFTLDNGLKVVVREDHRAPVVTSQLWFKVGSADEPPGQSGLSHALEHMLFKGSSKVCAGEAASILENLGASQNAFTDKDVTAYYQTLQPHQLGVAFELMADMMSTARLRAEDFLPERAVIQEERRLRVDDDFNGRAQERLASLAHPASSYGVPIIGWMHDLQRLSAADLRQWYQARYAPGNATLVVVGDVTQNTVKTLAERYFGVLPARPLVESRTPLELAEPGERKIILHQPIAAPRLMMAFNVPSLMTADQRKTVHALRLLNALLAGSNSARLRKRLQFGERVFSATLSDYNALYRGDSLFTLDVEISTQHPISLDDAQTRIWTVLDDIKATPPTRDELERVRTLLIAKQLYDRDAIEQQADRLGSLESIGASWRDLDNEVDELNQVTPEDIQHVAVTYLTRQRLSVAHVLVENRHE
ncbi:pitrilysin family protein [Pseudomonas sp. SZMC_28357]|uniref:M16 family metallopeptidase n=1 Tax=Pseudomonas sp. SZMC_28357 TaxID=3074380 RepID=UPI00287226CF|nr:pitrilysin family protein [Pseudomonas sp. SZMC_28357]MDR9750799.1 pitrilysin family protein [Pseudomonas sp. SZMC_28357]